MRILTVCVSSSVFGAEVVTLKMLDGFRRAGHDQLAVTSTWTDGEFSRRLAKIGVSEVRMPFGMISKKLALRPMWWTTKMISRLPWLWPKWRHALKQFNPDVVLLTSWRHAIALYPVLNQRSSFLIEHSFLKPTPTRRVLYELLARKLVGFIAVSEFLAKHVAKAGAPAQQIDVVRNGVFSETERAKLEQECFHFQAPTPGRLRIGIVGQIAPQKGHSCLVKAIGTLRRLGRKVEVFIFGAGHEKYCSELQAEIAQMKLVDAFHWMGYRSDRADIYGLVDVVAIPSVFDDPFPTVALEAGAYARPVVASRVGGLPEIIENAVTGWLVKPDDPDELGNRLNEFVENPATISQMGRKARERVFSTFTQEKMIAQFEAIFDRLRQQGRAA